jgi:hypothetical protein
MPRKDFYHQAVVNALLKAGWTITDDPLVLSYGGKDVYIDLGAEQTIGAEKDGQKIAVEIKTFLGASAVRELEVAIGQYNLYRDILSELEPERLLYLAVPERVYKGIFTDPLGQLVLERQRLQLLIFEESQERILRWIP